MKTLTKKQRREIYLEVAEDMFMGCGRFFICGALVEKFETSWYDTEIIPFQTFPELRLFEPQSHEIAHDADSWFGDRFEKGAAEARINALLFMSEMCNP